MSRTGGASPAVLAKGALRRLAQAQQEPTPENFARAYAEEGGQASAPNESRATGPAWAALVERLARNLERGGKQWTGARRKDSLQRVLEGSRSDANRLLQRLQSLMQAWEADQPSDPAATGIEDPPLPIAAASVADAAGWPPLVQSLERTVCLALGTTDQQGQDLAQELSKLAESIARDGALKRHVDDVLGVCDRAGQLLGRGHRVVAQLTELCRSLAGGLAELSEDDSWVKGQCERLAEALSGEPSLRDLRSAAALLSDTRQRQQQVHEERKAARAALRQLIQNMLLEVGELGRHTGQFREATALHVEAIAQADSLESLADVVKALLKDATTVQAAVSQSHEKLHSERSQALVLESRVRELEGELRRLSEEVSTDLLTQVANRRGLTQAFDAESARAMRDPGLGLAVALIDIDNFKKLNDTLGHAAGDVALKNLAAAVRERLRPVDHLARFGGEEFVVLLPGTDAVEAQQVLARLQRSLTEALFLHEGREVFVTFSAGVTVWRHGEPLQASLERADLALYEAKRTGKNRSCSA